MVKVFTIWQATGFILLYAQKMHKKMHWLQHNQILMFGWFTCVHNLTNKTIDLQLRRMNTHSKGEDVNPHRPDVTFGLYCTCTRHTHTVIVWFTHVLMFSAGFLIRTLSTDSPGSRQKLRVSADMQTERWYGEWSEWDVGLSPVYLALTARLVEARSARMTTADIMMFPGAKLSTETPAWSSLSAQPTADL